MAIPQTILDYLREHCVSYTHEEHRAARPSDEFSVTRNAAKTIIFRSNDQLVMAVLNEDRIVDMEAMKKVVGCDELAVLSEKEVSNRFDPCGTTTIPPFGALFQIPIYCDRTLAQQSEVEFHAGTATDTIRMLFSELVQIEAPTIADFSSPSDSTKSAA